MNLKTKKLGNKLFILILGVIALVASSYTRTFSAEFIQFPVIFAFFLLCGWLLNRFFKKILPYPFLFMIPTVAILVVGFFINANGFFHFFGELLMIVPGFFIGFYFFRWSKKTQLIAIIVIPAVYFIYITKLNPLLNYYNYSVRINNTKPLTEDPLSEFLFKKVDGDDLKFNELKGKLVLLDFYFNNCGACIKKMPYLLNIKNHYKNNPDFSLLVVNIGTSDSYNNFKSVSEKLPAGLNYVYDSLKTTRRYFKFDGYPVEILIDKNGKIRHQLSGFNADVALVYEKTTMKKIESLLNEE